MYEKHDFLLSKICITNKNRINKWHKNNFPLKVLLFTFCFTLFFCIQATAQNKRQEIGNGVMSQLKKVGAGTMSWMFLDIYQATLFTRDGLYSSTVYPQALTINYLKNINKKRLIEATKEQWLLQGFENEKVAYWLQSLDKIWPDIKSGDSLTFYVDENKKGVFYHNKALLGGINSGGFADAFLSIWLSDKTSEPTLRQQLLGL